jgi:hypothetical protein
MEVLIIVIVVVVALALLGGALARPWCSPPR